MYTQWLPRDRFQMMLGACVNKMVLLKIPRYGNIDQEFFFVKTPAFFMTVRNWSVCQSKSASSRQQPVCLWLLHDLGLVSLLLLISSKSFRYFSSKFECVKRAFFWGHIWKKSSKLSATMFWIFRCHHCYCTWRLQHMRNMYFFMFQNKTCLLEDSP